MWIDSYVLETLARDRMTEAQRRAARRDLLRRATPSAPRVRSWAVVQRFLQAAFVPRGRAGSRPGHVASRPGGGA